jgi:Xaa-Pro aminopeptidase
MELFSKDFKAELSLRWQKIQRMLHQQGADACLISTNVNLLYTTGRIIMGYVYIPLSGEPLFFVRRPYGVIENDQVIAIRKLEQLPGLLMGLKMPLPRKLMLEGGEMTYTDWVRTAAVFPDADLLDGTHQIRQVRSVKTEYELNEVRESARLQALAFTKFPALYKTGMTDHEFSVEMEREMRLHGCLGVFRIFGSSMEAGMCSVMAGDNADAPSAYDFAMSGGGLHPSLPVSANGSKLENGMSVMVDFGSAFNAYISDMTRVFSIGKLTQKAYDAHQVSLEIQNMLMQKTVPGATCEDLYLASYQLAEKYGFADCFMGITQQAKFVGHGIGLALNELPVLCDSNKELIHANMVIALEPKFMIPSTGAVGSENTYIVHENGLEKITIATESIIDLTV